jgi:adiponectin receptor
MLHNETGNIVTHGLASLFFIWLTLRTIVYYLHDASLSNQLVFLVFLCGATLCFLFSTLYHAFMCNSEPACLFVARLDYTGITLLILASFYPPIYFGFWCEPTARLIYLSSITVLGTIGIVFPLFEWYHKPNAHWFRVLLFLGTAASGIVPAIHTRLQPPLPAWFMEQHDLIPTEHIHLKILLMYLTYLSGVIVYLWKIPERWFPGQFDYYFHSHQIWHILTFLGTVIHCSTCFNVYEAWKASNGDCSLRGM